MTRSDIGLYMAVAAAVIVAVLVGTSWPVALPAIAVGAILLVVAAKKPDAASSLLLLGALPFLRPNILGESFAMVGAAIVMGAGLIAFAGDRGKTRVPGSYSIIVAGMAVTTLWLLLNATIFGAYTTVQPVLQGFVTTVLTVAAAGMVLADPIRRRTVGRGFIWIMLTLCGSYVVTLVVWRVMGLAALPLTTILISDSMGAGTVFFPFTPSIGLLNLSGLYVPRFTGLGREPGWMALYAGLALLLWRRIGRPTRAGQALLVVGILGTLSTAGFGAFVVVLILAWFARKPRGGDLFTRYVGFWFKLGALAAAAWVAVAAPVVGLASKGTVNAESLGDRSQAMNTGLQAMADNPFGGIVIGTQQAINLVAALAPFGIPYFLLVITTLFMPRIVHPNRSLSFAPIALIFITLLLSQPAGDATFVFILAGLAYTLALPDMHPDDDEAPQVDPRKEPCVKAPSVAYQHLVKRLNADPA